jgi:subtilase family serine protease
MVASVSAGVSPVPAGRAAEFPGSVDSGRAAATEAVSFEVFVPSRDPDGLERLAAAQQDPASPDYRRWIGPEERQRRFGPDPGAIATIEADLRASGFTAEALPNGVRASGTAAAAEAYLGLQLHHVRTPNGRDRIAAPSRPVLPDAVAALGGRIVSFQPMARMQALSRAARPRNRFSAYGPYWTADLREAYRSVSAQVNNGGKRTVGILMDADVQDSDMTTYFARQKLAPPKLTRIPVDGGSGFDPSGDSVESSLDVQQVHGMAPAASIRLYVLPNLNDQSIMDGLNQILSDNLSDIVSMSFGGCELSYSAAYNEGADDSAVLDEYHQIFTQGNVQGITFVASSGDYGALECPQADYFQGVSGTYSFIAGASSPATDPAVTAVGGTNLATTHFAGSVDSAYVSENAHDDQMKPIDPYATGGSVSGGVWGSGGGPSYHFAAPSWQAAVSTGTSFRATPDLAMHMGGCPADASTSCRSLPRSSVWAWIGGVKQPLIGTSAAAPDFAGVLALMEHHRGNVRLGNVNPTIYSLAQAQQAGGLGVFRHAIGGENGLYTTSANGGQPYNMVIGNGSVKIFKFIGAQDQPVAGTPFTLSNP